MQRRSHVRGGRVADLGMAFDLIEFVKARRVRWHYKELLEEFGHTNSSAFRWIQALEARGYVERDGERGFYRSVLR